MEKKFKSEKWKNVKNDGKGVFYIFYNLTKGIGIKRMRSYFSNIKPGELVKIDGQTFILLESLDPETKTHFWFTGEMPSQEELYQFRLSFA